MKVDFKKLCVMGIASGIALVAGSANAAEGTLLAGGCGGYRPQNNETQYQTSDWSDASYTQGAANTSNFPNTMNQTREMNPNNNANNPNSNYNYSNSNAGQNQNNWSANSPTSNTMRQSSGGVGASPSGGSTGGSSTGGGSMGGGSMGGSSTGGSGGTPSSRTDGDRY